MADKISKNLRINVIICIYGFLASLITNQKSGFQNSKWRIQYGGQNFKKSAYKRYNLYIWVFGVADYESEVRFSKLKKWWNRMQIRAIDKMDSKY